LDTLKRIDLIDILVTFGLLFLSSGLYLEYGISVALISIGAILFSSGFVLGALVRFNK